MKRKEIMQRALLCCFITSHPLIPLSFVYNLRISESTRHPLDRLKGPCVLSLTAANQHRLRNDESVENAGGVLGSFVYNWKHFYLRGDFAVAHDKNTTFTGKNRSNVETDDFLITFGTPYSFTKKTRCTLSGLVGFPTHKDRSFTQAQFGIGQYALGIQLDGQFTYQAREEHPLSNSVQAAVRFLHFFPRGTFIPVPLRPGCYDFSIGDLVDVLVSHRTQHGKNGFEFGYNSTTLLGATLSPAVPAVTDRIQGTRSSLYAAYSHVMLVGRTPQGISVGFSYSFDHNNNLYNLRRGFTAWFSWGINF